MSYVVIFILTQRWKVEVQEICESLYKTVLRAAIKRCRRKIRIVLARVMYYRTFSLLLWHNLLSGWRVGTEPHIENWASFIYYHVPYRHVKKLLQLRYIIVGHSFGNNIYHLSPGKNYNSFNDLFRVTTYSQYSCFYLVI